MNVLGGASFGRLEGALHAASLRQQVLSNNVANVDTPFFKRSDVAFEELLSQAMDGNGSSVLPGRLTNERHISIGGSSYSGPAPQIVTEDSTVINNDKNNVDIEKEMSMLAENQLRYNLFVQQINHDVKMMRIGIDGRA